MEVHIVCAQMLIFLKTGLVLQNWILLVDFCGIFLQRTVHFLLNICFREVDTTVWFYILYIIYFYIYVKNIKFQNPGWLKCYMEDRTMYYNNSLANIVFMSMPPNTHATSFLHGLPACRYKPRSSGASAVASSWPGEKLLQPGAGRETDQNYEPGSTAR